jgi:hypothetical protein
VALAQPCESFVLGADVGHGADDRRQAAVVQAGLVRPGERIVVRLEQQLDIIGAFGRDDRQKARRADWQVRLLHEAEGGGLEVERSGLIVDEHTGDLEFHGLSS